LERPINCASLLGARFLLPEASQRRLLATPQFSPDAMATRVDAAGASDAVAGAEAVLALLGERVTA